MLLFEPRGDGIRGALRVFDNSVSPELRVGEFISCIVAFDVTKIENSRIYVMVACESGIYVKYWQWVPDSEVDQV